VEGGVPGAVHHPAGERPRQLFHHLYGRLRLGGGALAAPQPEQNRQRDRRRAQPQPHHQRQNHPGVPVSGSSSLSRYFTASRATASPARRRARIAAEVVAYGSAEAGLGSGDEAAATGGDGQPTGGEPARGLAIGHVSGASAAPQAEAPVGHSGRAVECWVIARCSKARHA
jgi:hypothetical protein